MKRVLWCLIICVLTLTGCSTNNKLKNEAVDNVDNIDSLDMGDVDVINENVNETENEEISVNMQLLKYKIDEETGKIKYAPFILEPISYDGNEICIYASIGIDANADESVNVMTILLLNGQVIPFSANDGEELLTNCVTVQSLKTEYVKLKFNPVGLEKNAKSKLTFAVIPYYDIEKNTIMNNKYLAAYETINSLVESNEKRNELDKSKKNDFVPIKSIFDKYGTEFYKENGFAKDFLLIDNNTLFYMGDYDIGKYITYLFCDGKLYNGFDNKYYINWEKSKDDPGMIYKEIEINKLDDKEHIFFVITFCYDEEGNITDMQKSFNFKQKNK